MGASRRGKVGRAVAVMGALGVVLAAPRPAGAGRAPGAFKAILPATAVVASDSFSVSGGTMMTGSLQADLKGLQASCDVTVGSHVQIELRGDSAAESPLIPIITADSADEMKKAAKNVAAKVAGRKKSSRSVVAVGDVKDETVPGGRLVYAEYFEECKGKPRHAVTLLEGSGHSSTAVIHFFMTVIGSASDARRIALDLLSRFARLDAAAAVTEASRAK
jgi:hypothetical protein